MKRYRADVDAMKFDLLKSQLAVAQMRIAALERFESAMDARIHVLEIALARASHGLTVTEEPETRPRRVVDDRGTVRTLRESAA